MLGEADPSGGDGMTDPFNLNQIVREVLARGDDGADPGIIAKAVMREIPPRLYGEALAQALRDVVRVQIGRTRMDTSIVRPDESWRETLDPRGGLSTRRGRKPYRAPNQQGYVAHWRKVLQLSTHVNGAYKPFGRCTVEDLHWLRDDRYNDAAESTAKAEQYGHVADLLVEHGAEAIEDLPEHVLEATFQPRRSKKDSEGDAA